MPDDAYLLKPDERYVINFSGGRSSGYMLKHILEANGGLPDNAICIFTNTGKEREETLDFVQACGEWWGVEIVWLEYRYRTEAAGGRKDPKNTFERVGHNSASRAGEPFEQLIGARKMLPNIVMGFCTSELKVATTERFMRRQHGLSPKRYRNVLGIRHDEPRRWRKALGEECTAEYPMVHAGVGKADVAAWWATQPFDLGIIYLTEDQGRSRKALKLRN